MNTKRIDWTGQVEINSKTTKGKGDEKVLSNKTKNLEETKGENHPKLVVAPAVAEDKVYRSQPKESGLISNKTLPVTTTGTQRIDQAAPIRASIRKNLVQDVIRNKLC